MLYNLVAKESMIARYLKLSKIIPAVTAGRSILPGSAWGRELPLAAGELLLTARVLASAAPGQSWLRSSALGDVRCLEEDARGLRGIYLFAFAIATWEPEVPASRWRSQLSDATASDGRIWPWWDGASLLCWA